MFDSQTIASYYLMCFRYNLYDWAVIELDSPDLVPYFSDNLDLRQPCDYPTSISCGQTGI